MVNKRGEWSFSVLREVLIRFLEEYFLFSDFAGFFFFALLLIIISF